MIAHIALHVYLTAGSRGQVYSSSMHTFKDLYQFDFVLDQNGTVKQSKHPTSMNTLPVLAHFLKFKFSQPAKNNSLYLYIVIAIDNSNTIK